MEHGLELLEMADVLQRGPEPHHAPTGLAQLTMASSNICTEEDTCLLCEAAAVGGATRLSKDAQDLARSGV